MFYSELVVLVHIGPMQMKD